MALKRTIILAVLCLLLLDLCADAKKRRSRRTKRNHVTCRPRSLVRYQMTVHTEWDKITFPKMFPTYRPPAHWSQLIGRSHGDNYRMWEEGGNSSIAVQKFAEKENAEFFDLELSQGYNGVLDAFVAPTIETSVGQTSTVVSLDGRHSKVSFMMKIVPSPDWFVGLDSAELCYRGKWRRSYSRDLQPFDAGTDKGLTFTSPRWPNVPKEPISAITSSYPDHSANSFFYPEYKTLPRLAYVEFQMISEYRLRKVHKKISQIPKQNQDHTNTNTSQTPTEEERVFKNIEGGYISEKMNSTSQLLLDDLKHSVRKNNSGSKNSLFSLISKPQKKVGRYDSKTTEYPETKPTPLVQSHMNPNLEMRSLSVIESEEGSNRNPQNQRKYRRQEKSKMEGEKDVMKDSNAEDLLTQDRLKEYHKRIDCQVSEWSEWSSCSQTCGFGNKQRSRQVITLPKNGGSFCPLLKEETLCGSMRNCQWKHFSLMSGKVKSNSPFMNLKRRLGRRRRKH